MSNHNLHPGDEAMTHTPGPWERVDTADYAEIHPKGKRIASAIALVGKPDDADMIAAAPELLEALKRLTHVSDEIGDTFNTGMADDAILQARAAIDKATQPTSPPSAHVLESDPITLRGYCQQLLDMFENYGVEIEGEDNDLIDHIGKAVDPAHGTLATKEKQQ